MFMPIWTIARNTFTESIRQPIYVVLLLLVIGLLVINLSMAKLTLEDNNRLMIDVGLSTCLVLGMALAAFTASGVLAREIDNKTVLTVISKPIGRPAFVIGKFVGVGLAITMAYWIWSLTFLLTVRHKVLSAVADPYDWPVIVFGGGALLAALVLAVVGNYLYGWVFCSSFSRLLAVTLALAYLLVLMIDKDWQFQPITTEFLAAKATNYGEEAKSLPQLIVALLLVLESVWVLSAVAVTCSTRLGQVMTLVICLAVTIVGVLSDYLFGRHAESNVLAAVAYAITPNLQAPFVLDALHRNKPIGWTYFLSVSGYLACYCVAMLGLATALFQRRQAT